MGGEEHKVIANSRGRKAGCGLVKSGDLFNVAGCANPEHPVSLHDEHLISLGEGGRNAVVLVAVEARTPKGRPEFGTEGDRKAARAAEHHAFIEKDRRAHHRIAHVTDPNRRPRRAAQSDQVAVRGDRKNALCADYRALDLAAHVARPDRLAILFRKDGDEPLFSTDEKALLKRNRADRNNFLVGQGSCPVGLSRFEGD